MIPERSIITKTGIGGAFALTDHFGMPVTDRSWPDRYLLIFFGFTHCKRVCPRALAKLEDVIDRLGPDADRLRPLYVSVDPERDTPDRMREFLVDYPYFLGLTGSQQQIETIKAAYRVFAQRQADRDGDYDVPHSAITYLIAPNGNLAAHFVDTLDAQTVAARIRAVLENSSTGRTAD